MTASWAITYLMYDTLNFFRALRSPYSNRGALTFDRSSALYRTAAGGAATGAGPRYPSGGRATAAATIPLVCLAPAIFALEVRVFAVFEALPSSAFFLFFSSSSFSFLLFSSSSYVSSSFSFPFLSPSF